MLWIYGIEIVARGVEREREGKEITMIMIFFVRGGGDLGGIEISERE